MHFQKCIDICRRLLNELIQIDQFDLTLDKSFADGRYDSKINTSIVLAAIKLIDFGERVDG